MPRQPRLNLGGYAYHVINRAKKKVPDTFFSDFCSKNPLRISNFTNVSLGGPERIRTADLLIANEALYQLS